MKGQAVCAMHGGRSPQELAKAQAALEIAEARIKGLAPRAVDVLEYLLTAESASVALGAARDLTDRPVGKARERVEVAAAITVKHPRR
jgi:hypothetical protein